MTDPTPVPAPSFVDWLKKEAVERIWVSIGSTILGAVSVAAGIFLTDLATFLSQSEKPWAKGALIVVGILLVYFKQKSAVSRAALKVVPVLLALGLAAPALADSPFVHCLSGCPSAPGKLKADTQLTSTVWVGPGLGAAPAVYNFANKQWSVSAAPVLSYGLWWRPPAWTATKSLLGVNFSLSGEVLTVPQAHLDPLLMVNIIDNIQVGGGLRINFAGPNLPGGVDPTFAVYWTTSLGAP